MRTIEVPARQPGKSVDRPPTSRSRSEGLFPAPPTRGIDTIRVRAPYKGHGLSTRTHRETLNRLTGELIRSSCSGHEWLPDLGLRVSAGETWGPHAWFEFSVPRFFRVTNAYPEPVDGVLEAVAMVHEATGELVDWAVGPEDMSVTRLDYVNDITGVADIPHVLAGLNRAPGARGRTRSGYCDPMTGLKQSETVSSRGRWSVTAYDKATEIQAGARAIRQADLRREVLIEAKGVRARGQLRVEVSLRSPRLTECFGSRTLSDVMKADRLDAVARRHWDMTHFGTPVRGPLRVRQVLEAHLEHAESDPATRKALPRLLGNLLIEAEGYAVPGDSKTLSRYRQLASTLGISAADLTSHQAPPMRLDWETGSLLKGVAA